MFFFCFRRNGSFPVHRIDPQVVIRRLMPHRPPDKSGFLADDLESLLFQCVHWNTARSRLEPAPFCHAPSKTAAASWARLDNREELGGKLHIDPTALTGYCDTELILLSYLKWQDACVDHLVGDFVFVIYDREHKRVFCARDHMGVRPLYYYVSDDIFVCTTSLATLLHLEDLPILIDPQWVAEYLAHLSMSFESTPYRGIKKLPPAHCLTVTAQQAYLRQYFELSSEPALKLKDSREYVDAYREQLETAVRCRLESDYDIGTELSGGMDSSTITAYAARLLDRQLARLHAFAFSFSELEPENILAVSLACRLHNTHIFAHREMESQASVQRSLVILGYPAEHTSSMFHEPFYRLAEKLEIRTLLSGFGGDEFGSTTSGRIVPLGMLLQRRYSELFRVLPGNVLFRLLRLIKMELRRIRTGNFTKPAYNQSLHKAFRQRWPQSILRDELVKRYNLKERYFDRARFDAGYTDLKRFIVDKRWQPFLPTRTENCSLMAAGRGIEYRWPLLDIRLVRLFLSIPAEENYYRGMERYLHRRAIDRVVPGRIAWKRSKDMGAPMHQYQHDASLSLRFSISDLHPMLAVYIDTDKLQEQSRQISSISDIGDGDRRTQYLDNVRRVISLNTWMRFIDEIC